MPKPGSLPGIKHVIVVVGGKKNSAGTSSRTYRKLSRLWGLPLLPDMASLLPVYLTYVKDLGLCSFNGKLGRDPAKRVEPSKRTYS
ncbi:hypothetical protein N7510_005168 [Penicillium lagena]|uniref:uncharacterized protein n=1 Tax=Penicillium lagena TaxID=94218 RepID=UPI0025402AE3|nr:uncharacterized protein N7510_005168 [Penicillium lagena]KAJ5611974.1 hypothetical protein N7510_005168 [Penicillium lagena]